MIKAELTEQEAVFLYDILDNVQGLNYKQIGAVIGKAEGYVKNLFSGIKELEADPENMEILKKSHGMTLSDFQELKPVKDKVERKKLLKAKAEGKINKTGLRDKVKKSQKVTRYDFSEKQEDGNENQFINQFYTLDLDAFQLSKITRAIVGEALSKTRGKDRQKIITDIQKILKQYRGK